jgi:Phytanoyl-CoA dioxygenase (PhyH)
MSRTRGISIDQEGYFLLRNACPADLCDQLLAEFQLACAKAGCGIIRGAGDSIVGVRNLLAVWPEVLRVLDLSEFHDALCAILGPHFGLVRILYFDKPPGESWALPWHKDLAIAVKDNKIASDHFRRPTIKHGVPHVEAPAWLLEKMLTARLHLDEVTEENGPLRVIPGSHRDGTSSEAEARILCSRGDVLLMRPLLSHSSGHSKAETTKHRRILHFEFSPVRELPDGYQWHTFVSANSNGTLRETNSPD